MPKDPNAMFGAAVTVASVFAGFLIASKSILLSLQGRPIFGALRQSGYLTDFINYLREGINASVVLIVFSMGAFFVDDFELRHATPYGEELFYSAWIFCGGAALFTYWRASRILFKLLRHA